MSDNLSDDVDLQELQEEKRVRVRAMSAGIIAGVLAICFVVATAMWFDGKLPAEFGVAVAPSNPAASQGSAPAAPAQNGS